ncbi:MAG: hypothetical protein M0Z54_03685 [Thermaerobacter sp.]|nr:hypothetical protein [Thermaerobacter sp.]
MATLVREGETLWLRLSTAEKLESVHGDLHAPVDSVETATVLDDAIHAVHGMKLPGSHLPGVFAMGTFLDGHERTFAIVHHHPTGGVRVTFRGGSSYTQWIVTADDPAAVVASLGL